MKKSMLIILLAIVSFLLYGCDYPEKSFRVLTASDIPKEVTLDFELPRGYYAPFEWTSSNDSILTIYDQNKVRVNQQDIDVDVIITATINRTSESFVVKVLKTGSMLTLLEQSVVALTQIIIPNEAILPFELPTHIGNIYFKYEKSSYFTNNYDITEKADGSIWVLPHLVDMQVENLIYVETYFIDENNRYITLKSNVLVFNILVDHDSLHPHLQVFKALEITYAEGDSQHHVTQSFTLPLTSHVNAAATISWSVEPGRILIIDTDGKTVYIYSNKGTQETRLSVSITIDELTYTMNYPITIKLE